MGLLARTFYHIARLSSQHPILTILGALILTSVCCVGFLKVDIQSNPQKLWVDPQSRAYKEKAYFDDKFGDFYRVEQIIMSARHSPDDHDLFQKPYLEELWRLQSQIESKEVRYDDSLYTVDNYCYKPIHGKGCYISSPMDYWKMNVTAMLADPDIKATAQCQTEQEGDEIVCSDRNEIPIIRKLVFGGSKCIEGTSAKCQACKITAKALVITFLLENDHWTKHHGVEYWEKKVFEKLLKDYNDDDSRTMNAYYLSERSIEDELIAEESQNIWYIVISYAAMFLYVSFAIGQFPSRLHSRFMVGMAGIVVVICSVGIAMGTASGFGVGLSMISTEVVPFLILAIGVDFMFIISMGERKYKEKLMQEHEGEVPEHWRVMAEAMAEIGPSILAAAVSELAAFIVGMTTSIPALSDFCIIAAIALAANAILQCTVFVAVLTLDDRRRRSGRIDCMPCFDIIDRPPEQHRELVRKFVERYYVPALFHPITKVAVLFGYVAMMVLSVGGYSHLELGLDAQVTTIHGSDLYEYFSAYHDYAEVGPIAYLIMKNVNYTNAYNQDKLDEISDTLSEMKKTVEPPVYSWYKNFLMFQNHNGNWAFDCNTTHINEFTFNQQVQMFIQVPIESVCCKKYSICGEQYQTDIVFDGEGNIKASRFRFQHKALINQDDFINSVRDTRKAVDKLADKLVPYLNSKAELDNHAIVTASMDWTDIDDSYSSDERLAYSYSLFYIYYEQYTTIRGVALQNLMVAVAAVIFSIELLTGIWAAVLVAWFVGSITWGMIGLCYLWNEIEGGFKVEINAVSVVNLVLACGLGVEFCIHVTTCFLKKTGTRDERAKAAMCEMGSTVFTGIVSTKIIGVTVLGLAPSEVFNIYYFRMFFCIIILGFFIGLAFQPIILSWIGPPSENKTLKPREDEELPEISREERKED
jgi:Niemann-Pick C1 protein